MLGGSVTVSAVRTGPAPRERSATETFPVGGCKVLRRSDKDVATIVGLLVFSALCFVPLGFFVRVAKLEREPG